MGRERWKLQENEGEVARMFSLLIPSPMFRDLPLQCFRTMQFWDPCPLDFTLQIIKDPSLGEQNCREVCYPEKMSLGEASVFTLISEKALKLDLQLPFAERVSLCFSGEGTLYPGLNIGSLPHSFQERGLVLAPGGQTGWALVSNRTGRSCSSPLFHFHKWHCFEGLCWPLMNSQVVGELRGE